MINNYSPPSYSYWTGRTTDPQLGPQYWYQCLQFLDLNQPEGQWPAATHALVGYACDEGVRRNQGRVGAVEGPAVARGYLGKMAAHFGPEIIVADAGTIICPDGDLESCQAAYAEAISRLSRKGILPIGIGGGHDIAFGTYSGLRAARPDARIGIINFDAHFDLRPVADGPNSGTPFNQILSEYGGQTEYMVIGLQREANTPSLFTTARDFGVRTLFNHECQVEKVNKTITDFCADVDQLYLTVDLDGFSSAYAPGVSAPSPVGFSPEFFFPVLDHLLTSGKLLGMDIAEFNPAYDRDGSTNRLLGRIVARVVRGRSVVGRT